MVGYDRAKGGGRWHNAACGGFFVLVLAASASAQSEAATMPGTAGDAASPTGEASATPSAGAAGATGSASTTPATDAQGAPGPAAPAPEAAVDAKQRASALHQEANRLAATGQRVDAIGLYRRATVLDPDAPEHHVALGRVLAAMGALAEALTELERARALDPYNADRTLELGDVLRMTGRNAEARRAYERTLQLAPERHAVVQDRLRALATTTQPRTTEQPVRVSYGLGLGATYALSFVGSGVLAGASGSGALLLLAPIPPAILHFTHGNVAQGVLALFAWPLAVLSGTLVGMVIGCPNQFLDSNSDGLCAGGVVGLLTGLVGWPLVDTLVFAKETRSAPTHAGVPNAAGPQVGLGLASGSVQLRLSGPF